MSAILTVIFPLVVKQSISNHPSKHVVVVAAKFKFKMSTFIEVHRLHNRSKEDIHMIGSANDEIVYLSHVVTNSLNVNVL